MTQANLNNELKKLVLRTKNSVKGFNHASKCVREMDRELAVLFESEADLRAGFTKQLDTHLKDLSQETDQRNEFAGTKQPSLTEFEAFSTKHSKPDTVVKEVLKGEEKLVRHLNAIYSDLNQSDLETNRVVRELKNDIDGSIESLINWSSN